jgi:DNA-binding NarL/FixJ family response regulator
MQPVFSHSARRLGSKNHRAAQLKARMPAAKVLYVSGYPEAAIAHYGIVPGDEEFIQKPYSPDLLAARIREILGSP